LISGETGEYDDYTSWSVAAFKRKEDAESFKEKLDKYLEDHVYKDNDYVESSNKLDPNFRYFGDSVSYSIKQIQYFY